MKKITAFVLAIILCASAANAQLRYGVKAGANISTLSTTSKLINDVNTASSYQAGVLLQWKLGNFAIQPEVLYSVQGAELRNAVGTLNFSGPLAALTDYSTKLNYKSQNIEIPLNFQYGRGFGGARVYAQAGPYVSFKVGTALEDAASGTDYASAVDDALKFNNVDYGVGLGVGAELLQFQLSLKYDFGLKAVGKETLNSFDTNLNPFYDMKNRNLNISLAYLF
jgi:hypothetical protein